MTIIYEVQDTNDILYTYITTTDKSLALRVFGRVKQATTKHQKLSIKETLLEFREPALEWIFFENNSCDGTFHSVCVEPEGGGFKPEWNTDPGRCFVVKAKTFKQACKKLKKNYGVEYKIKEEESA